MLAAPAHADDASIHATATGTVATTDNVFATPTQRDGDIYMQLRPGVLFAYDAPRMIHELTVEAEVLEYVFHSDTPSLSGRVGWQALFLPGPRSDALVSVNGSTGVLNAITSRTSSDQASIGVVPTGAISMDSADASEQVGYQAGKHVRTTENVFARYLLTDDNMGTTVHSGDIGTNLSLERTWIRDTLALIVGGDVLRLERRAPPNLVGPLVGSVLIQQANPRAAVQWRHDFDRRWSMTADLGATLVNPYGTDPYNPTTAPLQRTLQPTATALVAYTEVWGRASLSVHRVVAPNLLIAENTVDTAGIAQVALPLPWLGNDSLAQPKLVGLGTFGVERTELLDATSSQLVGAFDVVRLDATVAWTPRPGQTWGVRYELIVQHGDTTAAMLVPSFYRNTLLVTFQLRYPERLRTRIPRSGDSVRSDRRDLGPLGGEPVVVDPAEETPDRE